MKNVVIAVVALLVLSLGAAYLFSAERTGEYVNPIAFTIPEKLPEHPELNLVEQTVTFSDGTETTFNIAEDFSISVAAEDLGKARFMAWSPDGRLFVPDIVDYNLSRQGRLFVLDDWNEETKRFETTHTYLSGLRGPNSVAFYTDENGQDWLYLALTAHLVRYAYEAGDNAPTGDPEIVMDFPNEQSEGEVSVVWHITRTIFFHNDRLYVSVGSGCNSCEELTGSMRAMIYSVRPDGSDERVEGEGLRNTVGIAMAEDELYATANGVDHLGPDAPDEMLYKVENGNHYGWPYCYVENGMNVPDTTQAWTKEFNCDEAPLPVTTFAPRSAPLGLRYFNTDSHASLADSFLVALHGSFEVGTEAGYEIRRVTRAGKNDLFMDGFLQNGERIARPVDFLIRDNNSFFFTDDHSGRIFLVEVD